MFSSELTYHSGRLKEVAFSLGRHALHLDASHGPTSVVAHGAQAFFTELSRTQPDLEVQHLRLWDDKVRERMEYNLSHVSSKMAMLQGNDSVEDSKRFSDIETMAASAASARCLVVSVPMWNYGAPWVLKQYFDCVLHPGLSFKETASGPQGLLGGGRSLVIITSAGGNANKDHLSPWLVDVAAMMGFDVVSRVEATNVAHGDREEMLARIAHQAEEVARLLVVPAASSNAGSLADADDMETEEAVAEWSSEELLVWLKGQGGLSEDALESIEVMKVDGRPWLVATEEDWQNEELGLEDADIARLISLQKMHTQCRRGVDVAG